jgi:hypothetical protein
LLLKRKLLFFGLVILVAWTILFGVDYYRFLANKNPIFSIRTSDTDEAIIYIGLGYKVAKKGRNVSEMITLFGKQRNMSFAEDNIKVIQEYLTAGHAKSDNAESFASFRIYGYSFISDEKVEVYLWVLEEIYFPQQGRVVKESGSSMPCLVTVDLTNGGFTVIGKQFPRDGSLYAQDMKEIFPAWVRYRLNNIHRSNEITKLSQENKNRAMQHFFPSQ